MHKLPDQSREQDDWIERIARPLRRPESLDPGFGPRLMSAIRAESIYARAARAGSALADSAGADARRASPVRVSTAPDATPRGRSAEAWRWFVRPRTFTISPAAGLAVAAGLAALLLLPTIRQRAPVASHGAGVPSAGVTPAPSDTVTIVQFVLVAPSAERVSLVGDFNNWDPAVMPLQPTRTNGGVWSISVPLSSGRHQYAFIVDGTRWMTDPSAPTAIENDFGVPNSVITVGERAS